MSVQFNIKAAKPAAVACLQAELGLPRFIAVTLAARGVETPRDALRFFQPSLDQDWLSPCLIPGLSDVADVVERAIRQHKHILVYGDFDLDGISATTVLTRGLRKLGAARVTPFIPRRFSEGYGLSLEAFERALGMDPEIQLVVTVDCGIACKHAVAQIVARGFEVVVTDHHEPSDLVPEGVPVADAKLDPTCPSDVLAGVGVALKLVHLLGTRLGKPYLWREYTDFATLGTVADLMPMRGENRALVSDGTARMNNNPRPCIAALLGTSGAADKPVTAANLSFSLVPRLNASGRMGDAQLSLDLLMTDDFDQASALAAELESVNNKRRSIEAELSEIAKEKAAKVYCGQRALVVWGEDWHEGVKGIVASRLVNQYGVPSLLFTIEGEEARGSGRTVGQVNLFKAVEHCSDLLTRFGGHEAAVGVTLPTANLGAFTQRLCDYMDTLPADDFCPRTDIDALVDLGELTLDNAAKLELLAPFGQENQIPTFLARNVVLTNCRAVGADKNHLSCSLTDGRSTTAGIMFHCKDMDMLMSTDSVVNAAFQVQIDEWRGRKTVKAMLKFLLPAQMCQGLMACLNPEHTLFVSGLFNSADEEAVVEDTQLCLGAVRAFELTMEENRRKWQEHAAENPQALQNAVVRALIGEGQLHQSQAQALEYLSQGKSTLAVMATGRGKSLIFQVHAAVRALAYNQCSLFVYPLRALIADQAYHLTEALEPFGVTSAVLTGETTPEERTRVYQGLREGAIDIILTTPEFLAYHVNTFASAARFGFMVVDEAHHVDQARLGTRIAYAQLGKIAAALGNPTVLALTATAGDGVAKEILDILPIDKCVFDQASRENLIIDDQRNLRNKDDYLANLVATGEKTVVYVNSREQSVAVARSLRRRVPHIAPLIGFYNAGLSRSERQRVEQLFRTNDLTVLVATSAFGEGVNIPNIRHVVLYHLPFNEVEFNQMAGRAGRDGTPAVVHLLYGRNDAALNEGILREVTPDHDTLAQVYRHLRQMQRESAAEAFAINNADLATQASSRRFPITPAAAACGVSVFRELGLIETHTTFSAGVTTRTIHVNENADRVQLTDSVRYREGLGEREIFEHFREWALCADGPALTVRVSHPIVPERPATKEEGDGHE
ncbi:MAG: single-stranded-DNA-specific exonuclease RecJ [Coriobacteriia bacterium]|nr:single-stranded-DNA-specific exonuclease RecJ [Coriobacteriia bacterium]